MLINYKEPGFQTSLRLIIYNRETYKSVCGPYYMATPEENKIGHNKNWLATRPSKYSLAWPGQFIHFVVAEKCQKNTVWTCQATCKGRHGGRLAQCVSIMVGR